MGLNQFGINTSIPTPLFPRDKHPLGENQKEFQNFRREKSMVLQMEEQEDTTPPNTKFYPEIVEEEDYKQLVQNADFFLQKLKLFHSSFGTNYISPSLGGETLDLHRLFVEVTSRGGLDQVIKDRKWDEVVSAFRCGITSFKRSFLLRKFYLSLLYHFEQAYFLKKKAPAVDMTDAAEQIAVVGLTTDSTSNLNEESTTTDHLQASVQIKPGASVVGVIDEKLDNGYVVTVKMGSDTLKGILYHIPDKPQPPWTPNQGIPRRKKRKKSQLSLVEYAAIKPVSQGLGQSFSNIGQMSNHQSLEPEKQFNQDKGVIDKEPDPTEVVNSAVAS